MAKFPEKTPRAVLSEAPSLFLARCDAPHAEGNMPKLTGLPEPTFTIPVDRCAPHPPARFRSLARRAPSASRGSENVAIRGARETTPARFVAARVLFLPPILPVNDRVLTPEVVVRSLPFAASTRRNP